MWYVDDSEIFKYFSINSQTQGYPGGHLSNFLPFDILVFFWTSKCTMVSHVLVLWLLPVNTLVEFILTSRSLLSNTRLLECGTRSKRDSERG